MKFWKNRLYVLLAATLLLMSCVFGKDAYAAAKPRSGTGVPNTGAYGVSRWAHVSALQQFSYRDKGLAYAYMDGKKLRIVLPKKQLSIRAEYDRLGDVISDSAGNIYVVWGTANDTDDASVETVAITKYNKKGKKVKTTGFTGISIPWGDSDGARTKSPFNAGNCVSVIHDNILVCYHAKQRYDGHQSDQVIAVNTDTMEEYQLPNNTYSGHSFDQGVIYSNAIGDFLFASLGDCYSRGFRVNRSDAEYGDDSEILFHSYLKANAGYDMSVVNETFAQFGGLDQTSAGVVLAGASVKTLGKKAEKQRQNLFIQIFDPAAEGVNKEMFIGGVTRKGKTALSMYDKQLSSVSDYGVIWLTKYKNKDVIAPQMVTVDDKIVLIWNESVDYNVKTYYMVLSKDGTVIKKRTSLGENCLNAYEKPIAYKGKVYWAYCENGSIRIRKIKV